MANLINIEDVIPNTQKSAEAGKGIAWLCQNLVEARGHRFIGIESNDVCAPPGHWQCLSLFDRWRTSRVDVLVCRWEEYCYIPHK